MCDGEDEDIDIFFEDKNETFSREEANLAETVRQRFDLDHEPAFVFYKFREEQS